MAVGASANRNGAVGLEETYLDGPTGEKTIRVTKDVEMLADHQARAPPYNVGNLWNEMYVYANARGPPEPFRASVMTGASDLANHRTPGRLLVLPVVLRKSDRLRKNPFAGLIGRLYPYIWFAAGEFVFRRGTHCGCDDLTAAYP